jgi:hypothetical protein
MTPQVLSIGGWHEFPVACIHASSPWTPSRRFKKCDVRTAVTCGETILLSLLPMDSERVRAVEKL